MEWFESHFELITDQLEVVALILFVPYAFVRFNVMGLLALDFFAVWACVLLWLIILVLVLLLFSVRLGLFGFLVLAFARLAPLLQ